MKNDQSQEWIAHPNRGTHEASELSRLNATLREIVFDIM